MGRLEGKVAFITGAGAGIAKASALALVTEGARVALVEINRELGRTAEKQVRKAGGDAIFLETDVTKDDAVKRAIGATVDRYGKLDVLVNCAGGSLQEDVPVHEMDLAVWKHTIALNLLHPFLCCRHGIPHMIKGSSGSIINFSSSLGMIGAGKPIYAAAKGGIVSFTRALAWEYAKNGIRANAIAPATVRTERSIKRWENKDWLLAEKPSPAAQARMAIQKNYPFSLGEPEDIASIVVFLASNESRMLTGAVIAADGGRSSYLKISD
ncbi:MAG: SDR family oxidoreductase [Betaproteobacteria bacterium]|nr:SDR family oxidoreductase [Betaproteobacteria bacterium]